MPEHVQVNMLGPCDVRARLRLSHWGTPAIEGVGPGRCLAPTAHRTPPETTRPSVCRAGVGDLLSLRKRQPACGGSEAQGERQGRVPGPGAAAKPGCTVGTRPDTGPSSPPSRRRRRPRGTRDGRAPGGGAGTLAPPRHWGSARTHTGTGTRHMAQTRSPPSSQPPGGAARPRQRPLRDREGAFEGRTQDAGRPGQGSWFHLGRVGATGSGEAV